MSKSSTAPIRPTTGILFNVVLFAAGLLAGSAQAQEPAVAGHVSYFAGGGGSITFGPLYDRARYGAHGSFGAAVALAPGITEAFELVASATGSIFPNDGKIGGDFLIANGGLEFRLVANLDHKTHYFVGVGGGVSRVREKLFTSQITGKTVDGFIEWGPYFAPGIGFDVPISDHLRFFSQAQYVTIFGNEIGNYRYLQLIAGLRL